jgi:uncharacterized protein
MRFVILGLAVLALSYFAIGLAMFVFQRSLIYRPDSQRIAPAAAGLSGVSEEVLSAPDGARLVAWWAKAKPGSPTLLYFHGNGGHLAERAERIITFHAQGFGVLMLAYRGYSGSTGSPSEAANVADGLLGYDFLAAKGLGKRDIVLFGESLGTGVAVQVAQARPAAGLVLDSPYTSLAAAGQFHYPWLPVLWLTTDRYDTLSRIGTLHLPLLILHGDADAVVPVAMGRAVFAAANEPKTLLTFPGAPHIHHAHLGSLERVREFVESLRQ